jgi:hypothetical protein
VQRSRTAPPPSASSENQVASLPEALPALEVLLEQARAPGAARAEVDALLAGLAQPLAPGQSPRERADLLLALIEDKQLGGFTGSKGRTVRAAAVEALLSLGYPYALEVPPDALETRPAEAVSRAEAAGPFSSNKGWAGLSLIMLIGLVQLIPALLFTTSMGSDSEWLSAWAVGIIGGTTFLPALMVLLGHVWRSRLMRGIGNVWLVLVGLLWMIPSVFVLASAGPIGLIPFTVGLLFIVGVALMESTTVE